MFPFRGTSKRPRTDHGSHDATSDVDTVACWWRRFPLDNIGTRIPEGLVVVDLDRHGDDESRHCRWSPDNFPSTLTTQTGTGWHLWWRAPSCELRAERRDLPAWRSVEVKRHAVTLPPSVHANGTRYRWHRAPIARMPALLVDTFRRETVAHVTSGEPTDAYIRAARDGVLADLATAAGPGSHHWPLLHAAYRYRDLGLTANDALADLLPRVPGHDQREARSTVRSVFR